MGMNICDDIINLALNDLQEKVISMGGRQLSEYGIPQPRTVDNNRFVREYCQEISYDRAEQQIYVKRNSALLTEDQHDVYDSFVPWLIGMRVEFSSWMLLEEQVRRS